MKVLIIHNKYLQRGGEDTVVDLESKILSRSHVVEKYITSNESLPKSNIKAGITSIWNQKVYDDVRRHLKIHKPDIIHIHNTFPYLSQSLYWGASSLGIPIIQTIHNYRSMCLNALLYRDGAPCTLCIGKLPVQGVRFSCYRGSKMASASMLMSSMIHKAMRSMDKVDKFIVLSEFSKQVHIKHGLNPKKIVVKYNFSEDLGVGLGGDYALYVGRLTEEKGILELLEAWKTLGSSIQLKIVGMGPLEGVVKSNLPQGVEFLGQLERHDVINIMKSASFLITPSRWYEGMPMTVVEAMSTGTPAISPKHGVFEEMILEGVNGFLYEVEDQNGIIEGVKKWIQQKEKSLLRSSTRRVYDALYSEEVAIKALEAIYNSAIKGMSSKW